MKTVIIGNHGHLGGALVRVGTRLGLEIVPLDLPEFDITARRIVLETLVPLNPDVIVNAAGIEQIDWLETHSNTSRSIHVQGTANLREAAKRSDALLLQFSTAEVFGDAATIDGFKEIDQPQPLSVYAKTKLDSERAASEISRHLLVRTSLVYGKTTDRSSGSIVETVLNAVRRTRNFKVLSDVYVSPVWTDYTAEAVFSLISETLRNEKYGLYHISSSEAASYFDIVQELARLTGLKMEIEPITAKEYGFRIPRTLFSVLDASKYHALPNVFKIPDWRRSLADYIDSRAVML